MCHLLVSSFCCYITSPWEHYTKVTTPDVLIKGMKTGNKISESNRLNIYYDKYGFCNFVPLLVLLKRHGLI